MLSHGMFQRQVKSCEYNYLNRVKSNVIPRSDWNRLTKDIPFSMNTSIKLHLLIPTLELPHTPTS